MATSSGFIKSESVSLEEGSSTIYLTGSVDCSFVSTGTAIFLDGGQYLVEGLKGSSFDTGGNSTITLREEWKGQTLTDVPFIAFNTIEGLRDAIRRVREVVEEGKSKVNSTSLSTFLFSTDAETVELDLGDTRVTTTAYHWAISNLKDLLRKRKFEDLENTPDALDGNSGRFLAVNSDETGIEFVAAPSGGGTTNPDNMRTTDLKDMPQDLIGQNGKTLQVNFEETGYELKDLPKAGRVTYGQVPSSYISGPLKLVVDGVETSEIFKVVDSYVPTAGDNVVAVGDIVIGVIATVDPLMESFCMFYGYPNAINSYWDIELSSKFYSQFHGVVFGDMMGEPSHSANADTVAIIARAKELNPELKVFGYVPIGLDPAWQDSSLSMEEIKSRITNWHNSGATHIFLDEYGYDYYVTRERQNDCILHSRGLGMPVVANSWSAQYCFSNEDMTISWLDNFRPNPTQKSCILDENDYVLFENVLYKFHHEAGTDSYANPEQWVNNNQRIIDMYEYMYGEQAEYDGKSYYDIYKTKGFALDSIINPDQKMYSESYLVALACGMHAHSASVAFWGAANSAYPTYDKPPIRAASRVALNKPVIEMFGDQYIGRLTTQIGPDSVEVTWVQEQSEIKFDKDSLSTGLEPKKEIRTVSFPPELQIVGSGFFTMTLGDDKDDSRNMSISITGEETREQLISSVLNYPYAPEFTKIYEVSRSGDDIIFTSKEPYTEELTQWWVWHTEGIITPPLSTISQTQIGTDGKSLEYREVRINGSAIDYGFGPYWRKPRKVKDGYIYFDTTNNRNISYRDGDWYDMNGNLADDFIEVGGVPYGTIVMIAEGEEIPTGWAIADGQDGRPLIDTSPNPTIVKIRPSTTPAGPTIVPLVGEAAVYYDTNILIYLSSDYRDIDESVTKSLIRREGGTVVEELTDSFNSIHEEIEGEWYTTIVFKRPTPNYKMEMPAELTFTMKDGTIVKGEVEDIPPPPDTPMGDSGKLDQLSGNKEIWFEGFYPIDDSQPKVLTTSEGVSYTSTVTPRYDTIGGTTRTTFIFELSSSVGIPLPAMVEATAPSGSRVFGTIPAVSGT